jgi:hypothetical protein
LIENPTSKPEKQHFEEKHKAVDKRSNYSQPQRCSNPPEAWAEIPITGDHPITRGHGDGSLLLSLIINLSTRLLIQHARTQFPRRFHQQ